MEPTSVPALLAAREYHKRAIDAIDVAIEIASSFDESAPDPTEFQGMSIKAALWRYLSVRAGRATFKECYEGLKARGCEMGERAAANLRTTITRNPESFVSRGDRILLTSCREPKAA